MPLTTVKKTLLDHETAVALIADAFNAKTLRAMERGMVPDAMHRLAEGRRDVMAYLEHLRLQADGKEIRR